MPIFRSVQPVGQLAVTVRGVDFNSANTDTPLPIVLPPGYSRYLVTGVRISGASASLTTASFSLYTAPAAGGTAILSTTTSTVNTASEGTNNNAQNAVPSTANSQSYNGNTLYFRVITPQGSAATANITLTIIPVS